MRREAGFSLLEMLVAMAIMMTVTGAVFALMDPSQGAFRTQPEVADLQQRLRVGEDTLFKDLVMAGGGAYEGQMSGSLVYRFAPVLPFRQGSSNDDPPGTFATDRLTLMYVPSTMAQTTLAKHGPDLRSAEIQVEPEPQCPPGNPPNSLCGFSIGMVVMMYDDSGHYDTFTITNVQDPALHIQHNSDTLSYTGYQDGKTKIVQVASFNYFLNTTTHQLMLYDGSLNPDIPVVDNVVGLTFEYYGDPQPPSMKVPLAATVNAPGPFTTYGPTPDVLVGENCVFFNDGSPTLASRLATLGPAGSGLVKLTAAELTDGPWCPDDANPKRWDADLLRIRKIGVTLRVQSAVAALRGPASTLFAVGGTSRGGTRFVPDQEIRFQVTPRNLNLGR